jgi:hypothetical protein
VTEQRDDFLGRRSSFYVNCRLCTFLCTLAAESACEQPNAHKTQAKLWRCGEQVARVQVPSIRAGKMLRVTTVFVPTDVVDIVGLDEYARPTVAILMKNKKREDVLDLQT